MKTAMQELILKLPNEFIFDNPNIILEALEKEKEQIIDAVEFGLFNIHTTIDGKYYYDLKYKLEI